MSEPADQARPTLRQLLTDCLTVSGWQRDVVLESGGYAELLGAFRRAVKDDFAVTATFGWDADPAPSRARRRPPVTVHAEFGMSYGPAYRAWPLVVADPVPSEIGLAAGDLGCRDDDLEVGLRSAADGPVAVDRLVDLAARAAAAAERYCSVDAYLGAIDAGDEHFQVTARPVVLAAAGRVAEARHALEEIRKSKKSYVHDPEYRRFVLAFSRWLDTGAAVPDTDPNPEAPDPDGDIDVERPDLDENMGVRWSFTESWAEGRDRTARRRAAREAVEAQKTGKSRSELLDLYRRELADRGFEPDPVADGFVVDAVLAPSRADRYKVGWQALGVVARSIAATVKEIKSIGDAPPDWLEPPLQACYRASRSLDEGWVWVNLSPDAIPTFERAMRAAIHDPLRDDRIEFEAWLTWEVSGGPDRIIAVHVGPAQVGMLTETDSARYRPEIDQASAAGQLPAVAARLTHRRATTEFVLELAAPTTH